MTKLLYIRIYPIDRNLEGDWFVTYKLSTGGPQKKWGKLKKVFTLSEKLAEAARIVEEIKAQYGEVKEKDLASHALIREIQSNFQTRSNYLRPKSVSTYNTKVIDFTEWYRKNHNSIDVINSGIGHAYIKYLRDKNLANKTINSYRSAIKEFWPKSMPNPFLETFKLPEESVSYQYFDEVKQQELAYEIPKKDTQLWLATQFQFYLLLRPNELRTLRVGQLNFIDQNVRVHGAEAKNHKTRTIAIPDELMESIQFLKQYHPTFYIFGNKRKPGLKCWGKKHFPDLHQAVLKKLGYNTEIYKFYSWKHTGAVMFYLKTGDLKALQMQGRWHSLDMVDEYLKNLGVMDLEKIKTDFPKIGGRGAAVIKLAQ